MIINLLRHTKRSIIVLLQFSANTRKMTSLQMRHHQITFLETFLASMFFRINFVPSMSHERFIAIALI